MPTAPLDRPRGLLLALALAVQGCTGVAPVVAEPLRVGNLDDSAPESLGLIPGVSRLDDARSTLAARGHTGIVADVSASAEGRGLLAVLAADYQSRVHVFTGGVYDHSLVLPTGGLPPYGMAVRIARDGQDTRLLVVYRDPLDRPEFPPSLLSFDWQGGRFQLAARTSLERVTARHDGMTRPALLGDDLRDGVLLVARDAAGALWDTSYFVRAAGGGVALQAQPTADALRCSCVRRYAYDLRAR